MWRRGILVLVLVLLVKWLGHHVLRLNLVSGQQPTCSRLLKGGVSLWRHWTWCLKESLVEMFGGLLSVGTHVRHIVDRSAAKSHNNVSRRDAALLRVCELNTAISRLRKIK